MFAPTSSPLVFTDQVPVVLQSPSFSAVSFSWDHQYGGSLWDKAHNARSVVIDKISSPVVDSGKRRWFILWMKLIFRSVDKRIVWLNSFDKSPPLGYLRQTKVVCPSACVSVVTTCGVSCNSNFKIIYGVPSTRDTLKCRATLLLRFFVSLNKRLYSKVCSVSLSFTEIEWNLIVLYLTEDRMHVYSRHSSSRHRHFDSHLLVTSLFPHLIYLQEIQKLCAISLIIVAYLFESVASVSVFLSTPQVD